MGAEPFDAVLLLSFGGPDCSADIMPFLRNVTRHRDVPVDRLQKVAGQYEAIGGASPINGQNRVLREAIATELARRGNALPVYWGNRNWHPFLADTLREMRAAGIKRAAVIVTSGYASYSGCRQYREDLFDAVCDVVADGQGGVPHLAKMRLWFDHPGFIATMVDNSVAAVRSLPDPSAGRLVFCTHSLPIAANERSGPPAEHGTYLAQHQFVAQAVATGVSELLGRQIDWDLVFQSRSGPPTTPWLEPDVSDFLAQAAAVGTRAVVLVPIGFASDHMEVVWDLDVTALAKASELGLDCVRAATAGVDERFVAALVDTVAERELGVAAERRPALSPWGPWPDTCPRDCCLGLGARRHALCGQESPQNQTDVCRDG